MYKHNLLIFVNAGMSAYTELPLDRHIILKAVGNTGKSSILNAFKLFWLPEINFAGCERKFKFIDRHKEGGYHSADASFLHYFPTIRSYIILAAENMHGHFCQVLYQRSNRGYGRLFIKCPYAKIEHLFWNKAAGDDGLGEPNPDLQTSAIKDFLKSQKIYFEDVTKKEDLINTLYSDSVLGNDSRFAIFPLKSQDKITINTLSTLIHTLCSFKADNAEMVTLFANIVEGQKKDESDILSLDFDKIMSERHYLDEEERSINDLLGYQPHVLSVFDSREKAASLEYLGHRFLSAKKAIDLKLAGNKRYRYTLFREKQDVGQLFTAARTTLDNLSSKQDRAEGTIKSINKDIKAIERSINAGEGLLTSEYKTNDFTNLRPVYKLIEARIETSQTTLKLIDDEVSLNKQITALATEKSNILAEMANKNNALQNIGDLLFTALSDHAKNTLAALSDKFTTVTINQLPFESIAAIETFAKLFTQHDDQNLFFGLSKFKIKTHHINKQDIEADLVVLNDKHADIESEWKRLATLIPDTNNTPEKLKQKHATKHNLTRVIKSLKNDEKTLREFESAQSRLKDKKQAFVEETNANKNTEKEYKEQAEKCKSLTEQGTALSARINLLDGNVLELEKLSDRANQGDAFPELNALFSRVDSTQLEENIEVDERVMTEIARGLKQYQLAFQKIKEGLGVLERAKIIHDADRVTVQSSSTVYSFDPLIVSLKHKFEQIESRREILTDSKSSHKSLISMKMQELKNNVTAIDTYRQKLNRMFETISINNLEGVQIDIVLDERFSNLLHKADSSELDDDFYDRLTAFISTFFKGDSDKQLTMSKIIKSVTFITKIAGSEWTDTGQSNSTVSLIAITLLQKMMLDIMNPELPLSMPLPLDEAGHIDDSVFPWLLKNLKQDGYHMFAASTNNVSPFAMNCIQSECCLGEFKAKKAYSISRDVVFFTPEGIVL